MLGTWPCPGTVPGESSPELVAAFDSGAQKRILVLLALLEEGGKLRHFTIAVMRDLDVRGLDSFLPDFSGCNESTFPLQDQSLDIWRDQARAAAEYFRATHVLTIRGGVLLDPGHLPGLRYAPVEGIGLLRAMLRARVISDREVGIASERDTLLAQGRREGLELSGYRLGPQMISQLADTPVASGAASVLEQSALGGAPLWLRAEPAHDGEQAAKLAALMAQAAG